MTGKSRPQILKGSARDDERGMQEEEKGEAAARESLIIFTFTSSDLALSHSLFFFFAVIFLSLLLRFVVFLSLSFLPAPVTYISFLPLHHPLFTFFFLLSTIYPPHPCFFLISSFLFFCLFLPSPLLHLLSSLFALLSSHFSSYVSPQHFSFPISPLMLAFVSILFSSFPFAHISILLLISLSSFYLPFSPTVCPYLLSFILPISTCPPVTPPLSSSSSLESVVWNSSVLALKLAAVPR